MHTADGMLHIGPLRSDHKQLNVCPPWHTRQIFEKNIQATNFLKYLPGKAELFHVDRGTDMTKLIGASRSSVNAPKKKPRVPICTHEACIPAAYIAGFAGLLLLLLIC
jgi:hypothetical protein